jgi:hypothetical protein
MKAATAAPAALLTPRLRRISSAAIRQVVNGFRHHTTIGVGRLKTALDEAFGRYLGYDLFEVG